MTDIKDFVKNHDLLAEDYRRDKGIAEFEHIDITKRINELNRTCVLALVGPYGSGKSTALHLAMGQFKKDTKWLHFDAWRYPERKALWDGLIIEIAKQLGNLKKIKRNLDGNKSAIGKWGGVTTSIFASLTDLIPDTALKWIGGNLHYQLSRLDDEDTKEIRGSGKVADKLVSNLFGRSAAKRAYEFEKILTDLLVSVKESRIVLVLEDVDRSGTDGLHFLETLSFYLSNNVGLAKKKIIAIAPVSEESYRLNEETYLKCVDYIEFFRPRRPKLNDFIEEVFIGLDMHPERLADFSNMPLSMPAYQTKYFLEGLFNTYPQEMSMRKLKMIIRDASSTYRLMQIDGREPNWQIVLCIQAMKYVHDSSNNRDRQPTYFDVYTQQGGIPGNTFFANTISAIHDERWQDRRPGQGGVQILDKRYADGLPFSIEDNFSEGSLPVWRHHSSDANSDTKFYLPAYYFKY